MARCSTCRRRLPPASRCPEDGGLAPAAPRRRGARPAAGGAGFDGRQAARLGRLRLGLGGQGGQRDRPRSQGEPFGRRSRPAAHQAGGHRSAQVGPPHVPRFVSTGVLADGRPYLSMERLRGRLLSDELERLDLSAPSIARVRALGDALLKSVAALHRHEFVHRDLKPENVFLVGDVTEELVAKLMDFGLSRPDKAPAEDQTASVPGAGTPEYMAPEQIAGGPADPALGCVRPRRDAVRAHHPASALHGRAARAGIRPSVLPSAPPLAVHRRARAAGRADPAVPGQGAAPDASPTPARCHEAFGQVIDPAGAGERRPTSAGGDARSPAAHARGQQRVGRCAAASGRRWL